VVFVGLIVAVVAHSVLNESLVKRLYPARRN